MENSTHQDMRNQDSSEVLPSLIKFITANEVAGIDSVKDVNISDNQCQPTGFHHIIPLTTAVRVNFFRGFRFSLAWWAYTFPMTGASIATVRYSNEVTNILTKSLSVILCAIATLTGTALLVTTIVHAFVLGNLFPNDIAIAISDRRQKTSRKWYHRRSGSSDTKDIENYLKFLDSDSKDIEASLTPPDSTTQ